MRVAGVLSSDFTEVHTQSDVPSDGVFDAFSASSNGPPLSPHADEAGATERWDSL